MDKKAVDMKNEIRDEQRKFMDTINSMSKLNIGLLTPELSPGEFKTMKVIIQCLKSKETRVSDIVKAMRVPPPAVSRTLRNLENKGYVERIVDKEDRRNTFVVVTDQGQKVFDGAMATMEDFADSVFANVGIDGMKQMNAFFSKLHQAAEAEIEKRKTKKQERGSENE